MDDDCVLLVPFNKMEKTQRGANWEWGESRFCFSGLMLHAQEKMLSRHLGMSLVLNIWGSSGYKCFFSLQSTQS